MKQKKPKALKSTTHIKVSIYLPRDLYQRVRVNSVKGGFRGATGYIEHLLNTHNSKDKAA